MAARRAKHDEEEEHENHERWLITYADMITLLMVLFIVLYAIGQTDLAKFERLKESLNAGLGGQAKPSIVDGSTGVLDGAGPKPAPAAAAIVEAAQAALAEKQARASASAAEAKTLDEVAKQIQEQLKAAGLGDAVHFRHEPRGLVVTVASDRVLFDSGSATLRPEGLQVLQGLAAPLRTVPNDLAIEGHTDDRPVRGTSVGNWELSTARATSVLRDLIEVHHFDGAHMAAAGYADQRPVAANDTDAHRAENRRVEVVILARYPAEEGAA